MRPKPKPLRDLYFRFGESVGLEWHHVADCLQRAGLIEYIPDRKTPYSLTYYRDTDRLTWLVKHGDPNSVLNYVFTQYKIDQGLE